MALLLLGLVEAAAAANPCPGTGFVAATQYTVGTAPRDVVVADFNGDGRPDLATANYESDDVSVLLADGAGSFAAAVSHAVATRPAGIVAADFNGDGHIDLATANYYGNNVSLLLGDGAGGFATATSFAAGLNPIALVNVDLNHDGRADLVVANETSNDLSVLLGDGAGGFAAPVNYAAPTGPRRLAVADFNEDTHSDVALIAKGDGSTTRGIVFFGDGSGGFGSQATLTVGTGSGDEAYDVAVADFDGNGHQDLAVGHVGSMNWDLGFTVVVSLYPGDGLGGFGAPLREIPGYQGLAVAPGDFDQDGRIDLAVADHWSSGFVGVWLGNGAGSFPRSRRYGFAPAASGKQALDRVRAADLNGDGLLDLVSANRGSGTVTVALGAGAGQVCAPEALGFAVPTNSTFYSLGAADFNEDGNPDLVGGMAVFLGNGAGGARPPVALPNDRPGTSVGDFNNDGHADFVQGSWASSVAGNPVSVFFGNGTGTFGAPAVYDSLGEAPAATAVGDLNGDGHDDIVVANQRATIITVFVANGVGGFVPATTYDVASSGYLPRAATLADFDEDGHLEVVVLVVQSSNVKLLWFPGDGTGALLTPVELALPTGQPQGYQTLVAADFTEDGHLDLAVSNGSSVHLLEGLGNGSFLPVLSSPADLAGAAADLAPLDFNGDGHLDLALANGFSNQMTLLSGDGSGVFTVVTRHPTGSIPRAVVATDLNKDGCDDLVVGDQSDYSAWVYLNNRCTWPNLLTVGTAGVATGSVTSSPAGIDCGDDCVERYASGTNVTLTATPDAGATFEGWQGACTGTGPCTVTMDATRQVTALFGVTLAVDDVSIPERDTSSRDLTFTVSLSTAPRKTVTVDYATADGLATAPSDYSAVSGTLTFARGVTTQTVNVPILGDGVAEPDETFSLVLSNPVNATLADAIGAGTIVNDDFTLAVDKAGIGDGSVSASGILCGADCSETYPAGTYVYLVATPTSGSYFVGWSGACTGVSACTLTMSAHANVTATFALQTDPTPPSVQLLSPAGGEYWPLSQAGQTPNTRLVTWAMSDNARICKVDVALEAFNAGSGDWGAVPAAGGLPASFGSGGQCAAPGVSDTSVLVTIPTAFPSGVPGSLYRISVTVADAADAGGHANETTATSTRPFYFVQPNTDTVRTLILSNVTRMQARAGITPAGATELTTQLSELADHPRVQGFVVDLGGMTTLASLYAAWDADSANASKANAVLFGCHGTPLPSGCSAEADGIHDVVRSLLAAYTGVKYLVLIGDDRIIPSARIKDRTYLLPESTYTSGADLTASSTVGQALAANTFLTDDPLGLRRAVSEDLLGTAVLPDLLPDLAVGRLVETPQEIGTAIATFIAQDGVLDLTTIDPTAGHKVLVTGYDFLIDAGKQVARRWKTFFPTVDGASSPVDDILVDDDWGAPTVPERQTALETHLGGNGGPRFGIANLNGHATHYIEGVPGSGSHDIQGLGADRLAALDLAGSVLYAVGCHGGLSVPGSASGDADHSLDLPQTFLARGVLAYVANTGYGWGLRHGIGYAERLVQLLTEEMTTGGTIVTGDAVRRTKQRYYLESPRYDVYDEKSLMQWTFFGLPMYAVRTGIAVASGSPSLVAGPAPAWPRPTLGGVQVDATQVDPSASLALDAALSPPPSYLTQLNLHFDLTAPGVYRKWQAGGELAAGVGCSDPNGCYYTLNGLVERSTGAGDLPVQPYFVYDSRLSGTSQHGVLWKGGVYQQESGWVPVFAQLESNGGDASDHGDLARTVLIGPVRRRLRAGAGSDGETSCSASDAEMSSVVVPTGESVRDGLGNYSIERTYRTMDLEVLYFNNTVDGVGNCDREGPLIGAGPFAGSYHQARGATIEWRVPVSDAASAVWRVVVVVTDGHLDGQGRGTWEAVELADAGGGLWTGTRTFAGGEQVTYVVQAVDARGNITWLPFMGARLPASGVAPGVPQAVELTLPAVGAVQFTQAAFSANENAGSGALTVVRSGDTSGEATVAYSLTPGTATAGVDYVPVVGTLTFAVGETSRLLTVPLINDDLAETSETLAVTLSAPVGASLGATATATLTVIDDDSGGDVVQFKQASYTVVESGPVAVVSVMRSGTLGRAVTVDYTTGDGTAQAGRDYTAVTGTAYFPAGQAETTFLVPILSDSQLEPDETVNLSLSTPTGGATLGTPTTATLTIVDDERQVQFALAAINASEGLAKATVTVKRTGVMLGELRVEYFTADGTATAGLDYLTALGTLTFAQNVASKTFTVSLINDTLDEPNETILLGLRNVTGGVTGPTNASVLTILDNDVGGTLQFSLAGYTVTEAGGSATITVTRSGGAASGVTVDYATSNGSATAGLDYAAISGTLSFAAAKTTATFTVPITEDALAEGVETVNLTLSNPTGGGKLGTRPTAVLSITDNETAVGIATPALTVTEGGGAAIIVKRTGSLVGAVTVPYSLTPGTATPGTDYKALPPGTLTFGSGVAQKTLSVPTIQDTIHEDDETLTVTLGTPGGATPPPLGVSTATITIKDNDPAGTIAFARADTIVSEAVGFATVTVKRTGGTASGVTVQYATSSNRTGMGSAQLATAGQDYAATSGTLTFGTNQVTQTFRVPIMNDTAAEGEEQIQLVLTAPTGGARLGTQATAVLTIAASDGVAALKPES